MRNVVVVTLVIGAVLVGARILANDDDLQMREQRSRQHATVDIAAYDLDGDGAISRDEYDTAGGLFDVLDRNGDGQLSQRELGMFAHRRAARSHRGPGGMFRQADTDGDRIITVNEWDAFVLALDADSDGAVTRPGRGDTGTCAGRRPGANKLDPDGDCVIQVIDLHNLFTELDADGNGELTREELPRPTRSRRDVHGK